MLQCVDFETNVGSRDYKKKFIPELCPDSCLNGGKCIAENQCLCPSNFHGNKCEDASKIKVDSTHN